MKKLKPFDTKEEKIEMLKKVLRVHGMEPTQKQLENMYEFTEVMERVLYGTFLCSKCGGEQHIYELRAD